MYKITLNKFTATTETMEKALEMKNYFESFSKDGETAIIEEVITSTDINKMLVEGLTTNNNSLIAQAIVAVANGAKAPFIYNKKLGCEVAYFKYCKEVLEASTYEDAMAIDSNGYAIKPWMYVHHPEVVRFSNVFYGIWMNQKDVDMDETIKKAELMLKETEASIAFNYGATTKVGEYWLKVHYPEYHLLTSDFRIAGFNYLGRDFDDATFGSPVVVDGEELFRIQTNDKYKNVICKYTDGLYHRLKDLLIEDLVPAWVQEFLLCGSKDIWSEEQQAVVYACFSEGVDIVNSFCDELKEKFQRVKQSFVKEKEEEYLGYRSGFKADSEELAKAILRMANAKEPDRLEAQIQINLEKAPIKKVLEALKRAIEAEKVSASAEGLKKQTCFVINQLKKADVYSVAVHADRIIKQREEEDAAIEAALASRL